MDPSSLSSIWNASVGRPGSRTASASNEDKSPPKRLISPSLFSPGAAARKTLGARSPGWNLGAADPLPRPNSSNPGRHGNASHDAQVANESFWEQYHRQQSLRKEETEFMLNVLHRLDQLQAQVDSHPATHHGLYNLQAQAAVAAAEKSALSDRVQRLEDRLKRSENLLALDPFVLVLIDGDHFLFDDDLVSQGGMGGEQAATRLKHQVNQYISSLLSHVPPNPRVVVNMFSDSKSLSQIYTASGLIQHVSQLENFQRAFSRTQVDFNWIDVGRDYAQAKIKNSLLTHLQDPHCRHIIVGCSQGIGKSQMLEPFLQSTNDTFDLVTLIQTGSPKVGEQDPNYRSTALDNVFHAQNISFLDAVHASHRYPSPPISDNSEAPTSRTNSAADMKENLALSSHQPLATVSNNPTPLSWASTVKKPAPPLGQLGPSSLNSMASATNIPRNRAGQRIDPLIKHDKDEVDRVKKMKLCNVHFLRDECPFDDECSHVHRARPTANDLKYLALVARMAPCMNGSWCEDAKCIYGHNCPAPEGRRGELCIFADQCRFPKELHKIDRNIVRTKKV